MPDASHGDHPQHTLPLERRSHRTGRDSLDNHADSNGNGDRDRTIETMQVPSHGEHFDYVRSDHEMQDQVTAEDMSNHDDEPNSPGEGFFLDTSGQPSLELLRALETKPITTGQLIQEVKGIYSGLVLVERKCIEIVTAQTKNPTKLSKEQWQALNALHRTVLNEHHDFFAASHHPVTKGHELRELAGRYAMAARMWRHGIHAHLELLRNRLPDSQEFLVSFIYLAYSMMTLLMETVQEYEETWIECLGDLARYRMAVEESDPRDREVWAGTARMWYNKAADLCPNTGRIQHHLAVLARPFIVQQLYLYSKALVAAIHFKNAQDSIILLFNPLLEQANAKTPIRYQLADFYLVCAAGILFKRMTIGEFQNFIQQFLQHLDPQIARQVSRFKVTGPEMAGSLFNMLLDFGREENTLWTMLFDHQKILNAQYCESQSITADSLPKDFVVNLPEYIMPPKDAYWSDPITSRSIPSLVSKPGEIFQSSDQVTFYAGHALYAGIKQTAEHVGDKNIVAYFHMVLAHLYALTFVPGASVYIENFIPWDSIAKFLNTVGPSGVSYEIVEASTFPKTFGKRQLPEDFVMRGLMLMTYYFPANFFDKDQLVDEDERLLEQPSHQVPRVERCLWAGVQLARLNRWLTYDSSSKHFDTTPFARSLSLVSAL